jgi:hypothetical protein
MSHGRLGYSVRVQIADWGLAAVRGVPEERYHAILCCTQVMAVAERWAAICNRWRHAIWIFWLVVTILGYIWGLKFLDNTVSAFPAPKGRYVTGGEAYRCTQATC